MIWLIGIGGLLGSTVRFLLGIFINSRIKKEAYFPYGTWMINSTGSFLLGVLANLYLTDRMSVWIWFLFGIGFCGAYTTFSTFAYETITIVGAKKGKVAWFYVIASVFSGVLAAGIGFFLANIV
ncbi:fluoride efflux transporter CrcB [Niallia endozanthoxylica]|uniref:Fluoride-specific ion channel FluC n=1 Tax=Niallia endozanthoxylica TaxID=2036016 RepID=A0A5J5HN42_9BACI|nr:fluoride efflux transporter CrcB [Niallia endozanthoxylica]KAA9021776.1 fluoride efflux transporter CrcB [Niallia endozanthoxylica]